MRVTKRNIFIRFIFKIIMLKRDIIKLRRSIFCLKEMFLDQNKMNAKTIYDLIEAENESNLYIRKELKLRIGEVYNRLQEIDAKVDRYK